jgi:hypothetical protein
VADRDELAVLDIADAILDGDIQLCRGSPCSDMPYRHSVWRARLGGASK